MKKVIKGIVKYGGAILLLMTTNFMTQNAPVNGLWHWLFGFFVLLLWYITFNHIESGAWLDN